MGLLYIFEVPPFFLSQSRVLFLCTNPMIRLGSRNCFGQFNAFMGGCGRL